MDHYPHLVSNGTDGFETLLFRAPCRDHDYRTVKDPRRFKKINIVLL